MTWGKRLNDIKLFFSVLAFKISPQLNHLLFRVLLLGGECCISIMQYIVWCYALQDDTVIQRLDWCSNINRFLE